jgi:hypothetical protein
MRCEAALPAPAPDRGLPPGILVRAWVPGEADGLVDCHEGPPPMSPPLADRDPR